MARKKTSDKPPKSEGDKAAIFVRLAEQRTGKALKAIQQLQHLANPSAYVYQQEQVDKIVTTLKGAVESVAEVFANPKAAKSTGFKL